MNRLKGKVALITQAGGNFGRTIAEAYAEEGADLFLHDWVERQQKVEGLAKEIAGRTGRRVVAGFYDITTGAATAEMTRHVMSEFSRVDILVNTGMQAGHGKVFDIREQEWDLTIARGLKSYFLTCQYVGEEMALAGYGKIINLTSIVARLGSAGSIPWGACRGGVDALTFAMAQALGEYGVRVMALCRGAMESTPYTKEARDERLLRLPLKRLGLEEDIKGPAVFLATAESDFVLGSVLYCDGGYAHAAATDSEHRAAEIPLKTRGTREKKEARELDWLDTEVF